MGVVHPEQVEEAIVAGEVNFEELNTNFDLEEAKTNFEETLAATDFEEMLEQTNIEDLYKNISIDQRLAAIQSTLEGMPEESQAEILDNITKRTDIEPSDLEKAGLNELRSESNIEETVSDAYNQTNFEEFSTQVETDNLDTDSASYNLSPDEKFVLATGAFRLLMNEIIQDPGNRFVTSITVASIIIPLISNDAQIQTYRDTVTAIYWLILVIHWISEDT